MQYGRLNEDNDELKNITQRLEAVERGLAEINTRQMEAPPKRLKSHPKRIHISQPIGDENAQNLFWTEDSIFQGRGKVVPLGKREKSFWQRLIPKYLTPKQINVENEEELRRGLLVLRNKTVFAVFMMNAIFITAIFLLQVQEELTIPWPLGEDTYLEPIEFLFGLVIAFILAVQFGAMLFHRFATFSHILSSTYIYSRFWCNRKVDEISKNLKTVKGVVPFIQKLQQSNNIDEEIEKHKLPEIVIELLEQLKHTSLLSPIASQRVCFPNLEILFIANFYFEGANRNSFLEQIKKFPSSVQAEFRNFLNRLRLPHLPRVNLNLAGPSSQGEMPGSSSAIINSIGRADLDIINETTGN